MVQAIGLALDRGSANLAVPTVGGVAAAGLLAASDLGSWQPHG